MIRWRELIRSSARARQIAAGSAVATLLTAVYSIMQPARYASELSFVAEESGSPIDGLAGIASQFGVRLPSRPGGMGPDFYRDLVLSRPILEQVARGTFAPPGEQPRLVEELMKIRGRSAAIRLERTVKWLRTEALSVTYKPTTGVVSVQVVTRWPEVSRDIASAVFAGTQRFNIEQRQSRAAAESEFLTSRVESSAEELGRAERAMQSFLVANRLYESSPPLRLEYDRLNRELLLRQQVHSTLVQAFEQARIERVRATPVLTVISPPNLPARPVSRSLALKLLLAAAGGALIVVWAVAIGRLSGLRRPDGS